MLSVFENRALGEIFRPGPESERVTGEGKGIFITTSS
jgi:hypothetical protein